MTNLIDRQGGTIGGIKGRLEMIRVTGVSVCLKA